MVYLDLCSGPGATKMRIDEKGEHTTRVIGSPIISLLKGTCEKRRFDEWHFFEHNEISWRSLRQRVEKTIQYLKNKGIELRLGKDVFVKPEDCNRGVKNVIKKLQRNYDTVSVLVFVDPEGFTEVKWETWEKMLECGFVDIIWTYPSSAIKRGIENSHYQEYFRFLTNEKFEKLVKRNMGPEELLREYRNAFSDIIKRIGREKEFQFENIPVENYKNSEMYRVVAMSVSPVFIKKIMRYVFEKLENLRNKEMKELILSKGGLSRYLW